MALVGFYGFTQKRAHDLSKRLGDIFTVQTLKDAGKLTAKVAVFVLSSSCGAFISGKALGIAGSWAFASKVTLLSKASFCLKFGSALLLKLARLLFLSVAVPTYALVYELPKWLFTVALPQMGLWAKESAIWGVDALAWLGRRSIELAGRGAIYCFNHFLKPLGDLAIKAMARLKQLFFSMVEDYLIPALKFAHRAIVRLFEGYIKPVLELLKKALFNFMFNILPRVYNWTLRQIVAICDKMKAISRFILDKLFWVCRKCFEAMRYVVNNLAIPLFKSLEAHFMKVLNMIQAAFQWSFKRIFKPFLDAVLKVFEKAFDLVKKAIDYTIANIVLPLFTFIKNAALFFSLNFKRGFIWAIDKVLIPAVKKMAQLSSQLYAELAKALVYIYDKALIPALAALRDGFAKALLFAETACEWLANKVIAPLFNFGLKVTQIALRAIKSSFQAVLLRIIIPAFKVITENLRYLFAITQTGAVWLKDRVVLPLLNCGWRVVKFIAGRMLLAGKFLAFDVITPLVQNGFNAIRHGWSLIQQLTLRMHQRVLSPFFHMGYEAAKRIFESVKAAFAFIIEESIKNAKHINGSVLKPGFEMLASGLSSAAETTKTAVSAAFKAVGSILQETKNDLWEVIAWLKGRVKFTN